MQPIINLFTPFFRLYSKRIIMMEQDLLELLLEINEISKSVMEVSQENEQLIQNLKARGLKMNYFWSRNV